jgi:hypothetical protein
MPAFVWDVERGEREPAIPGALAIPGEEGSTLRDARLSETDVTATLNKGVVFAVLAPRRSVLPPAHLLARMRGGRHPEECDHDARPGLGVENGRADAGLTVDWVTRMFTMGFGCALTGVAASRSSDIHPTIRLIPVPPLYVGGTATRRSEFHAPFVTSRTAGHECVSGAGRAFRGPNPTGNHSKVTLVREY